MADLHLNIKGEYFDAIRNGKKNWEYRLVNEYWTKRLMENGVFKKWDKIIVKRGYPKRTDKLKHWIVPWKRIRIETITHPHFGDKPVKVFAIWVAGH